MSNLRDKFVAAGWQVIEVSERLPTWNEWLVAHDELPIQEWLVAYINVQPLAPMETTKDVESHDDFIKQRLEETVAKLESLTKERDEARREICDLLITSCKDAGGFWDPEAHTRKAKVFATSRGWDCFKEDQA